MPVKNNIDWKFSEEAAAIEKMVDEFAAELKRSLIQQLSAANRGWADPENKLSIYENFVMRASNKALSRILPSDMVASAAYAAMLFNIVCLEKGIEEVKPYIPAHEDPIYAKFYEAENITEPESEGINIDMSDEAEIVVSEVSEKHEEIVFEDALSDYMGDSFE